MSDKKPTSDWPIPDANAGRADRSAPSPADAAKASTPERELAAEQMDSDRKASKAVDSKRRAENSND